MRYKALLFIAFAVSLSPLRLSSAEEPVYFADANLESAVERAMGITDPTPTDMLNMAIFRAVSKGIVDLTGLEYAKNLWLVELQGNQIVDISPLSSLTKLQWIYLCDNQISDVSPLSGLTNFHELDLDNNQIVDLAPLLGLKMDAEGAYAYIGLVNNPLSSDSCSTYIPEIRANNPLCQIDSLCCYVRFSVESGLSWAGEGGRIIEPGEGVFSWVMGTSIPIKAVPDPGWRFAYWNSYWLHPEDLYSADTILVVDGSSSSGDVRACFEPTGLVVKTACLPEGAGTVTRSPDKSMYAQGEQVALTAVPAIGYRLSHWTDQTPERSSETTWEGNPLILDVYRHMLLTAVFDLDGSLPPDPNEPSKSGKKTLIISSSAGGRVSMPGQGTFEYDSGTVVTVVAQADSGYDFLGWTGTAVSTGKIASPSSPSTSVTIDADCTLQATFGAGGQYALAVVSAPPDGGSVVCAPNKPEYSPGEQVTLTATSADGYSFKGWSGDLTGVTNPATITMNSSKSVTANFEASAQYTLTLAVSPGDAGFVMRSPDKPKYAPGEQVTLTAVSSDKYEFSGWSGSIASWTNPVTITMNYDMSITANYQELGPTSILTISSGTGGYIYHPGEGVYRYEKGANALIQAISHHGFSFLYWTGTAVMAGKVANPDAPSTTVRMDDDYTLMANFEPNEAEEWYILALSSSEGGYVRNPGDGVYQYKKGTSVEVVARALSAFTFSGWTGTAVTAGKVMNPSSPSTTVIVDNDYTLRANFKPTQDLASLLGRVIKMDAQGRACGPLSGATVELVDGGKAIVTTSDAAGGFQFTELEPRAVFLTVSKTGYYSVTRSVMLAKGETKSEEFQLTPESKQPATFDFSSPKGNYFIEGMPGDLTFYVSVAWNGSPGSVYFIIDGRRYAATTTDLGSGTARATLTIPAPREISSCGPVRIEVTNGEKQKTIRTTGVYFRDAPPIIPRWYPGALIWHLIGSKFTCSDEVSYTWGLPTPDRTIYSLDVSLGYHQELAFDPFAGLFAGELGGFGVFEQNLRLPKAESLGQGRLDIGGSLEILLAGCGWELIKPAWNLSLSGKSGIGAPLFVALDIIASGVGSALIKEVPVLGDIKLYVFLTGGGKLRGEYADWQLSNCFLGATSVSGSLTYGLEAKFGLDEPLVKAFVFVGGTGTPEFRLCPGLEFERITLKIYTGVSVYALGREFSKEVGSELTFYDSGSSKPRISAMSSFPVIDGDESWKPIGTECLRWGEMNHLTEERSSHGVRALAVAPTDHGEEQVVLENVTPLAAPAVMSIGPSDQILFSLHDPNKPWYAATDIAVVQKATGQPWALRCVSDDLAAEFDPRTVVTGSGEVLATWERVSGDTSDTNDPAQVAPHLEIVTARLDRSTGDWSIPQQVTSNAVVDRAPLAAVFGDNQGILWVQNEADAMSGSREHGDQLMFIKWSPDGWGNPQVLWNDPNGAGILDVSFVANDDEGYVAFIVDTDGDPSTQSDRELYSISTVGGSWQKVARLTDDSLEDASPALMTPGGSPMCVWKAGGELVYSYLRSWNPRNVYSESTDTNDVVTLEGVTMPVGAAIAYTVQGPNGVDIMAAFYDASLDVWSLPRQLTFDEGTESALSLACDGNDLVIAYLKTQTLHEGMDIEINGQMQHLENVPQPGRTDLYMLRHTLAHDPAIAVQSLTVQPSNPAPGQAATISAIVENKGDLPLANLQVAFYDGDPCEGGTVIGSMQTIPGILIAGGKQTISIPWNVPLGERSHRIFVVVDPNATVDDRNPGNNRASKLTVLPDLAVETCWSGEFSSTEVLLTARLTNTGVIMSGPFRASWRLRAEDGKEIATSEIGVIPAGGVCEISQIWDAGKDLEPNEPARVIIVVDSAMTVPEFNEGNNSKSCAVLAPALREDPTQEPIAYWKFDEGTGTAANDSAGTNPGTVYGAKWLDGRVGKALRFDGLDDYVDCGNAAVLAPEQMTIAFWMFAEGRPEYQRILGKGSESGNFVGQDYIFSTASDGRVEFTFGQSFSQRVTVRCKDKVPVGRWVHIAATRDRSTVSLYVDGLLENTASYSFVPVAGNRHLFIGSIGSPPYAWEGRFKGQIDDVRIYDKALSTEEVLRLCHEVSP